MTGIELEGIILSFYDCILDEDLDRVYFELTPLGKEFCDTYKDCFGSIENKNVKELDIYIKKCSVDKFSELLSEGKDPQQFYGKEQTELLMERLQEYCQKEYKTDFPKKFDYINKMFALYCREFENLSYYISGRIDSYLNLEFNRQVNRVMGAVESRSSDLEKTTKKYNDDTTDKVQKLSKKVDDQITKMNESVSKTEKKTAESSITILGIFSAVVLTFNAAVSFSSIILETLINTSVYRSVLITLLFGLILGNVIVGLFAYLEFVRKKQDEENSRKSKVKCVLIGMNVVIVGLICATLISWCCGSVECRNDKITAKYSVAASADEAQTTTAFTN